MSVILITNHDETIYDITKKPVEYHKPQIRKIVSSGRRRYPVVVSASIKKPHATMGLPKQPHPDPTKYIRKHSGIRPSKPTQICELHKIKKDWNINLTKKEQEKKKEVDEEQDKKQKNFVLLNIKKAIKMKPKEPKPRLVVHPRGSKVDLNMDESYKTYFGKTPDYLKKFIRIQGKIYQNKKDFSVLKQPNYRYVTREEREQILNGLKHNWDELQVEYQKLPILTDTIPKKMRKSKLEAELKQLEHDIVLLERHPYIYVYNDDVDHFNE